MSTIKTRSFARAGLLGNPSDGYFGKSPSFAFADYCVDLTLSESARMRFVPGEVDDAMFDSPEQLVHDLRLSGYINDTHTYILGGPTASEAADIRRRKRGCVFEGKAFA